MTGFLRTLRLEWLLRIRTLRFRIGVPLYLALTVLPAALILYVVREKSHYHYGGGTYLSTTLDFQKFLTVLLAILVAGARVDLEGWQRMVPVLGGSPLSNARVLLRRWAAVVTWLVLLSAVPIVVVLAMVELAGVPAVEPSSWLGRWLLSILPIVVATSAFWLAAVTIAGSELGALMFSFAFFAVSSYVGSELGERLKVDLDLHLGWLGFWDLRYGIWRLFYLFDEVERRHAYSILLDSDFPPDLLSGAFELVPHVVLALAASLSIFALATAFLRRNRSDVRPISTREDHPLRTVLLLFHRFRHRYTPDGALRWEKALLAVAISGVIGSVAVTTAYQERYAGWLEQRYRTETESQHFEPTPRGVVIRAWQVEGEVHADGLVELTGHARLHNESDLPVDHLAWGFNAFLNVEISAADVQVASEKRAWGRTVTRLRPALPPGETLDLRVSVAGVPKHPEYRLDPRRRRESFVLEYRSSSENGENLRRNPLALSKANPLVSPTEIRLPPGNLLPLLRYETWELTPPPALRGEPGLQVPLESSFPVADLELRLRVPEGQLLADSCGFYSRDGVLESRCRTAPGRYALRGGPLELVQTDGVASLFALPGHTELALKHFEALELVGRLAERAWPAAKGIERLVAIEMPGERGGIHALPSYSNRVYGNLVAIPEWWMMSEDVLTVESIVGRVLARQLLQRRRLDREHELALEFFLSAFMAQRMGLGRPDGATITGRVWDRPNAGTPILSSWSGNRMVFETKLPALVADIEARVGSARLGEAIEAMLASDHPEPATVDELLAEITAVADFDAASHYGFYFREIGFPRLRMRGIEVRSTESGGYRVEGLLINEGQGPASCEIVVRGETHEARQRLEIVGAGEAPISIEIAEEPHTAALDPEKECFRWVDRGSDRVDRIPLTRER